MRLDLLVFLIFGNNCLYLFVIFVDIHTLLTLGSIGKGKWGLGDYIKIE